MKALSTFALALLATGCSVGSFSGSVAGATFTPKDAVSAAAHFGAQSHLEGDLPAITLGVVFMTSTPNACDDIKNHIGHANEKGVLFGLVSVNDTGLHPGKGEYSVDSAKLRNAVEAGSVGKFTFGSFAANDETCHQASSDEDAGLITAGKLTLDAADENGAHGSYNLTFGTSDKVTGSFSASDCASLQTTVSSLAKSLGYTVSEEPSSAQNPNVTCKP